jgi:hypothetical protein
MWTGDFAAAGSLREIAAAARDAPAAVGSPRATDLLLDGLALLITEGHEAAAPALKGAVSAFCGPRVSGDEGRRWLWLAWPAAQTLWDAEAWHQLSVRGRAVSRRARDRDGDRERADAVRSAPGGGVPWPRG